MSVYNGPKFGVAGFTDAGLISGIDTSARGTKAQAPEDVGDLIAKRTGVESVILHTDKLLRDEYQRRITGEVPSTRHSGGSSS
jgi:hypothetical protein